MIFPGPPIRWINTPPVTSATSARIKATFFHTSRPSLRNCPIVTRFKLLRVSWCQPQRHEDSKKRGESRHESECLVQTCGQKMTQLKKPTKTVAGLQIIV